MKPTTPDRWAGLWRQVSAKADPDTLYQELHALYTQPHRHYHTLQHILECLAEFDSARELATELLAMELAIWFHDAIYDTHAYDNEERSAELARRRISEAAGNPALSESVGALILSTKAHDPSLYRDAGLMVDVDLSILGKPEARIKEFEAQVRKEYEWVPEATFAAKRAEILERFLDRKRIYTTDVFAARYEKQARLNLANSISNLKVRAASSSKRS